MRIISFLAAGVVFLGLASFVILGLAEPDYSKIEKGGSSDERYLTKAVSSNSLHVPYEVSYPHGALGENTLFDKVVVYKSARLMFAYSGGKIVRVYQIALGREPVGHKEFEGDMKTPEGTYFMDNKNPNSAYHKNLNVSYPNANDRDYAKKMGKSPGGNIKIHGLPPSFSSIGSKHRLADWTLGCIAVTDDEIDELFERVVLGSPIIIKP